MLSVLGTLNNLNALTYYIKGLHKTVDKVSARCYYSGKDVFAYLEMIMISVGKLYSFAG